MDEYVYTSSIDFKEMLLLNQPHFINMCKGKDTLQLNAKSYMEDYS